MGLDHRAFRWCGHAVQGANEEVRHCTVSPGAPTEGRLRDIRNSDVDRIWQRLSMNGHRKMCKEILKHDVWLTESSKPMMHGSTEQAI